jgi:hypothetical protein
VPAPLASWNPARDVWETSHSHIDLFSGLSAVWSETFPSWGMWAGGVAYELPTSAHLTDGSASSSSPGLLPTPMTSDAKAKGPADGERNSPQLRAIGELLPTPTVSDANGAGTHGTGGPDLRTAVSLLPTPRATDGTKGGPNRRGSSGDLMLPSAVMLLPTPTATDGKGPGPLFRQRDGKARPPADDDLPTAVVRSLLPTPRAQTGEERNQTIWARDPSEPQNLENALAFVLPPKPREVTDPPPGDGRHGQQLPIEED